MCLLCIEIQKENMTPREIARAMAEKFDFAHAVEIAKQLSDKGIDHEVQKELDSIIDKMEEDVNDKASS